MLEVMAGALKPFHDRTRLTQMTRWAVAVGALSHPSYPSDVSKDSMVLFRKLWEDEEAGHVPPAGGSGSKVQSTPAVDQ